MHTVVRINVFKSDTGEVVLESWLDSENDSISIIKKFIALPDGEYEMDKVTFEKKV